jgi:hypothetical protein
MGDRAEKDWVRLFGTIMVVAGVGMWVPYAVGKYLLGWTITDRDFLPYHLAVIIPGMVLRYYRFFFFDLWKWACRGKKEEQLKTNRTEQAHRTGVSVQIWIIINNFIHDMVTGLWVSSVIVISLLKIKDGSSEGVFISAALHDVMRFFFWLGIASIVLILMTGSLRMLYFRRENAAHNRETKKKLLIVKHVLLTTVFIGGTYLAYLYAFK